ncbi:MAG: AraC family transcriptional regulator [Bacteroides sp.]|nr:AraC family transcriptional regulator [Bacteroides sp.]
MDAKKIHNVGISQIHHLPRIDFIDNDFAIFQNVDDVPIMSYPARLNATCLSVCLKGTCSLEVNLEQYHMEEGMLNIILPDQIVRQGERSDDFEGLFIAVSTDFLDVVLPTMQQLFPLFFQIKERPCIKLTSEELQSFREYHSFLWGRVKRKEYPFRKEITQGILLSLFYEIYNIYRGHETKEPGKKSRKEDLFERFIRLVSESYKSERRVAYYAERMFVTPKHLSSVVKEVSGRTAGEWIDSLVVLEAKVLLKSSELSIQEISDELTFANQSFFGKYFKNHTGLSPSEYRKQ